MPYSTEDLLRDCAGSKHSRLKGDAGKYKDIWNALSNWIRSRVQRRLGAAIPGFGQWLWYSQDLAGRDAEALDAENAAGLRLGFSLSERFSKSYHLASKLRDCAAYRHTKTKDVNVYEVAIRFSQKLKKDEVFSGLKDILQAIGTAAHSNKSLKISFGGVGAFRGKERKMYFEFDPEFLSCSSPEPMPQLIQSHGRPVTAPNKCKLDLQCNSRAETERSVPHLIGGPFKPRDEDYAEFGDYIERLAHEDACSEFGGSRPSTSSSFMSQLDNGFLSPGGQGRVQRWMKQERKFRSDKCARVPPSRRSIHHPHTEAPKRTEPAKRKPQIIKEKMMQRPSTASTSSSVFQPARNKKQMFQLGRLVL